MPLFKDMLDLYSSIEKSGHADMKFPSVWHEVKTANLEYVIDTEGNLVSIRKLEKYRVETNADGRRVKVLGDADTVAPVTLSSEARTNGSSPKPLLEGLKYVAGDLDSYLLGDCTDYHNDYLQQLHDWNDFAGGNEKLNAILKYIEKDTVCGDLLVSGIVDAVDEIISKYSVRFVVEGADQEKPWEDEDLMASWDRHMEKAGYPSVDIDYVSGGPGIFMPKHPKNIISENPNGKLISFAANELSMFNTLGERFTDISQTPQISMETSVKAHRMLRWLISNRSVKIHSREGATCWICFSKNDPRSEVFDFINKNAGFAPADYGALLRDALVGKKVEFPDRELTVLALDYSTKGRDSIVYYMSVDAQEFLSRLIEWRERYSFKGNEEGKSYYPSLYRIVMNSYGAYTSSPEPVIKDVVLKKNMNRLMETMLGGRQIPEDIVFAAVANAGKTAHCSNDIHGQILTTAYILVAGRDKYLDKGIDINMAEQSRSYLYGRLLALYDWIEAAALFKMNVGKDKKSTRSTNAKKYWGSYVKDPDRISPILHQRVLRGYMRRLSPSSVRYYEMQLDEVYGKLDFLFRGGKRKRGPLNDEYILGYTHQKQALRTRSKELAVNNTESGEE